MNTARSDHSMASLHGRLFAIGGRNDNDNGYVDSVEVYDPDKDSWTLLRHKLDGEVYYTAACVINKYHVERKLKYWLYWCSNIFIIIDIVVRS